MTHLTDDQIARWHSRSSSPDEILEVVRHVAACRTCSDRLSAPHTPEKVERELEGWLESERREPARLPARRALVAAALAASVVVAVGLVVFRRDGSERKEDTTRAPRPTARSVETPGISLRDGPLVVRSDGRVEGVPARWRSEVDAVARGARLVVPEIAAALVGESQRARGSPPRAGSAVRLLQPLSVVTTEDRPRFSWEGPPNARYRLEVYDARFAQVARSGALNERSWQPSEHLPRGETLTWKVVLLRGAREESFPVPPAPPAIFRVVSASALSEIEDARATGSHLVTGLVLFRAGALDEARTEFEALRAGNPGSSLPVRLLETTRE